MSPYITIMVALSGHDKSAPHLTRETICGRRPADGADTPGGVFRPGDNLTLGRRGIYSLRMPLESIGA